MPTTVSTRSQTAKILAKRFEITTERVYQIEKAAINKIRQHIINEAAASGVSVRDWLHGGVSDNGRETRDAFTDFVQSVEDCTPEEPAKEPDYGDLI